MATHSYWVAQKVHSGFSIRHYRKTQTNFSVQPNTSKLQTFSSRESEEMGIY